MGSVMMRWGGAEPLVGDKRGLNTKLGCFFLSCSDHCVACVHRLCAL